MERAPVVVARLGLALAVAALAAGSLPAAALAPPATLTLVGASSLGNRGMNAGLAVAGHCAFVGSRNDAAPQVVDIADPAAPRVVGGLTRHPGSTPREVHAVGDLREVMVLYYALAGAGPNRLEIYRWEADCASPTLVGHYDFDGAPHEFFLWRDPAQPGRVLLYVSMFAAAAQELQVIDASNPASPAKVGGWAVPPAYGHAPLHSIDVSGDGRTAYISLWTGGLVVADTSDFASGAANPLLRPLTPPGATFRSPPGNVHSAVPLPGTSFVLTTDERYPSPFGTGCPFGTAHVVDVSSPARPVAVSTLSVPENLACGTAPKGTWSSHNPTLTGHLALVSWYSAGLQVFAMDDPRNPNRLAEYRRAGNNPTARDLQLGTTDALAWSYPVIAKGLVYLVDINQGLEVLRYAGPHQDEVSSAGLSEGNSNISGVPVLAAASPRPSAATSTSPLPAPALGTAARHAGIPTVVLAAVVVVVVGAGGGLLLLVMRRRRRIPSEP